MLCAKTNFEFGAALFESNVIRAFGKAFLTVQNAGSETNVSPRKPVRKIKIFLKLKILQIRLISSKPFPIR